MSEPSSPDLLLAAPPDAPGARRVVIDWVRAASDGSGGRVLLAGTGLAWAADVSLTSVLQGRDVAVCSRNATDAGWRLETAPAGIRWSSVATWLAELAPGTTLWVALP